MNFLKDKSIECMLGLLTILYAGITSYYLYLYKKTVQLKKKETLSAERTALLSGIKKEFSDKIVFYGLIALFSTVFFLLRIFNLFESEYIYNYIAFFSGVESFFELLPQYFKIYQMTEMPKIAFSFAIITVVVLTFAIVVFNYSFYALINYFIDKGAAENSKLYLVMAISLNIAISFSIWQFLNLKNVMKLKHSTKINENSEEYIELKAMADKINLDMNRVRFTKSDFFEKTLLDVVYKNPTSYVIINEEWYKTEDPRLSGGLIMNEMIKAKAMLPFRVFDTKIICECIFRVISSLIIFGIFESDYYLFGIGMIYFLQMLTTFASSQVSRHFRFKEEQILNGCSIEFGVQFEILDSLKNLTDLIIQKHKSTTLYSFYPASIIDARIADLTSRLSH